MKKYNHLNQEERDKIAVLVNRGKSLREIAELLGRDVSTLSRELKRNGRRNRYLPHKAHERAQEKQHKNHKRMRLKCHALRLEVEKLLLQGWSPEIIAGRLKHHSVLPRISHEAIYQWIYSSATYLTGYLVCSHRKRRLRRFGSRKRRILIPNRISIQQRPLIVHSRLQEGHWETDLLVGKGVSAIQVAVERKTRFAKLKKIQRKTALLSRLALTEMFSPLPLNLRRSITYDNGPENTGHKLLNNKIGTASFFCEPYHSWEKGSVENTNGLVRRFLPKQTNFDTISESQLLQVESWLNNRPRKCLNFDTPAEVFLPMCCT